MRPVAAAAVLAALLSVTACTSSAGGTKPIGASTGATSTVTSAARSSPTPSPTKTAAPLSGFENDPAVRALRAWMAEAGRAINGGHHTSAALQALMTPELAKTMKHVLGSDVGSYYPGPLPFTPISVQVVSSTQRKVRICAVLDGYALNPKTHKPAKPSRRGAVEAGAVLSNGRWVVASLYTDSFSCSGVKIPEPSW